MIQLSKMPSMLLSTLACLFKPQTMTREELFKNATGLEEELDCISHYDALHQKGMYVNGYEYPLHLYKIGVQRRLQDMADATHPQVHVLVFDDVKHNCDASYAGQEFAKLLRVHSQGAIIVLRIYVKHPRTSPETIPVHLLGSVIWNMISLVPDEFKTSGGLHRRHFKAFKRRGPDCFERGVRVLSALPRLDLKGRKLFCIVDGLELAEDEKILDQVQDLVRALRDVMAWNHGQLVYTFSKESKITHSIRMLSGCQNLPN